MQQSITNYSGSPLMTPSNANDNAELANAVLRLGTLGTRDMQSLSQQLSEFGASYKLG